MIVSIDKNNFDHVLYNVATHIKAEVPLVIMTKIENFKFNNELYNLDKYVLIDYCENGFDWDMKETPKYAGEEWDKFYEFIDKKPPIVTFRRELLRKDVKENILPVEWPCFHPVYPIQTKEEFDRRPLEVFHFWGHSSEIRRVTHGNIWIHASKHAIGVVDNFAYFEQTIKDYKRVWASIYAPYFDRKPIEYVLSVNGNAKLSLSLTGAGRKCFRHSEASVNAVMVMEEDSLAWSVEWVHGFNCIKVSPTENIPEIMEESLRRDDLYSIYLNGIETIDKLRIARYCKEYIEPIINKFS